ncbi:heme lyase CcmF/NrfE family subunit [Sulfobacillus thermosulfidooxidans]|uniref:heme lyase CcmF/NrfE family subunit n=1 Tax=Sulfobacillus thermosulfidooxidans TaxID=28034 RepID=UPI001FA6B9C2|nr:cytochrome c-type biogenesis CcmF C-terminal domain-containing protein [Sulfobacillus thermosulfidooxidans]
MPELGRYALVLAGGNSLYIVISGTWNRRLCNPQLAESVRGAVLAVALALTTAVFTLEYLLVTGNYTVQAVYNHSDRALPLLYKMGALWGGNSGSILFWAWILSLYTVVVTLRGRWQSPLTSLTSLYLTGLLLFFTGMSNLVVNPFRMIGGHPADGAGLDPLLQNVVMSIHPPAMYIGLIGMAVPAAYLLAALWTRAPMDQWVGIVRRWTLFAWMFLSAAIVLGGMWAYMELGWGGYWEWDPVENASLMPWLLATAFLHSLQAQEKRGILRAWTAILGVGSFLLTVVGTYITRSGILKNSVHSFTGTGVGPYFLALLILIGLGTFFILWSRQDVLQGHLPENAPDLTWSKESVYRLVNVLFSSIAVIVLFGTFYPVLSHALMGTTIILTQEYFNRLTVPLFLMLAVLLGVAPAMGWRRTHFAQFWHHMRTPLLVALGVGVVAYLSGFHAIATWLAMIIVGFASTSMIQELVRAAKNRQKAHHLGWQRSLAQAISHNRRRYGGYLAHIAFLLIIFGVAGSHTHNIKITTTLKPHQQLFLGGYKIAYQGMTMATGPGYQMVQANLLVRYHAQQFREQPALAFFPGSAQPVAKVAIHGGWMKDLYCVFEGSPGQQEAILHIFINPFVRFIWTGMYILIGATLLSLGGRTTKERQRSRSLVDITGMRASSLSVKGRDPF